MKRDRITGALRRLVGRRGLEREVAEEIESHLAHRVDDLIAEGMEPGEARQRAREEFGDVERLRREAVAARRASGRSGRASFVDALVQDLAFALRQLRRAPGFALTAVATLGLGIAATATVAGVVDAVVLEPLPFESPDELVYVQEVTPAGHTFSVSEPTFGDWREQTRAFSDVGASTQRSGILAGAGEPRLVSTLWASASFLPVLGVEPVLGRGFTPAEDRPGARGAVALLSDHLWREVFGADREVLGTDVVLNGEAHRVVGVLPPGLPWVGDADVVVPLGADPAGDRSEHYLDVVARLAPATTLDAARRELEAISARLSATWPEERGWGSSVITLRELLVGPEVTRAGWVLLAAAGLLLLIACVNVSNLLLARATVRRTEIGVRMALGAGRGRVTRQLLTESLTLAGLGTLVGLGLAWLALPVVRGMGGGRIPRLEHATLAPDVTAACVVVAAGAALLFGLAPILDLRGRGAGGALGRTGRGTARRRGARGALVAAQVALSVVLLVSTGLLARSFTRLAAVDPGFRAEGTLSVRLSLPEESYDPEERKALMRALLDEARSVPGVRAVGATVVDPFGDLNLMNRIARSDRMPAEARDFPATAWRIVTPEWTDAMGVELLAGRAFEAGDGWSDGGTPVLVNRALVERLWPGGGATPTEAVGASLVWGDPDGSRLRVVGVVDDVRDWRLDEEVAPVVYRSYEQIPWTVMTVVARTEGRAGEMVAPFRQALRRAGPALAIPEVRSLDAHLGEAMAMPRFHAILLAVFATSGLALAGVGIYGVTAFDVTRRFREIGIRMAVGGDPGDIRRLVLGDTLRVTALGVVAGGAGAWLAGRWLESLLYRTSPSDPVTWGGALGVVVVAGCAAAWIPARRATRVQPTEVLSAE